MKELLATTMISALLALSSAGLRAADPEPIEPPLAAAPFNLSFKGGSPAQLVEALAAVSGSKPNVLVPPELADVKIPPIELRSVEVSGVFESLNLLWRNSMVWGRFGSSGHGGAGNHGLPPVYVLSRGQDARQTRAYVGHLLKKFKIDDVTTAVRSTWELGGRESKTELKYHQDTQLLLALGSVDQLNAMSEVLGQLKLALEQEPDATPTPPAAKPKASAKN